MKSKKGDARELLFTALMLILAIMVGAIMLRTAVEARDPQKFQKDYLSKDIASLLDIAYGIPYNYDLAYTSTLWNFSDYGYTFGSKIRKFRIGGEAIIVYGERSPRYYKYVPDGTLGSDLTNVEREKGVKKTVVLLFRKNGKSFSGGAAIDNPQEDPIMLACEEKLPAVDTIVLDPGHGSGAGNEDEGNVHKNFKEAERTLLVSNFVKSELEKEGKRVVVTRGGEKSDYQRPADRVQTIKESGADLVLSFHMGHGDKNILKAYVPYGDEPSRQAACKIISGILSEKKIKGVDGAAIVPVNIGILDEEDPLMVLSTGKLSVMLELGSVDSQGSLIQFVDTGIGISKAFK